MDLENFKLNYLKILNGRKRLSTKEDKQKYRELFDACVDNFCEVPEGKIYFLEPNRCLYRCPGCNKTISPRLSDVKFKIGKMKCRKCVNADINKTYEKTCEECGKLDCKYFGRQEKNKYSKAQFCYTVFNLENPNLGWNKIWENNEEVRNKLLKHLNSHNQTRIKYCKDCEKRGNCNFTSEKPNFFSNAIPCYTSINFNNSFDRDKFYSNINVRELDVGEIIVDINSLKGIPGVWSTWSGDICLDVFQTKDIGEEIIKFQYRIKNKFELGLDTSKYKWDSKYENYRGKDINFILVVKDILSRSEREFIEAQYAAENKALLWSPAPGQIKI